MDPYGLALKDYSEQKDSDSLILHNSYGEPEEMPLWYFFREYEEMPDLEKMALSICEGHVLDIGAGTGCHAICLQQMGHQVTAIDTCSEAVKIMKASGVANSKELDYFEAKEHAKYDTLLCLMNGIGFIGKIERLKSFLEQADRLLKPGGQIVLDSSDIRYLYEGTSQPTDHYYGEVKFQYEYKSIKSDWFDWVYFDKDTLDKMAFNAGWFVYFLHSDENDQYLVRLIKR